MHEFVNKWYFLDQITGDVSNNFIDIIFMEFIRMPKAYIFVARRILAIRFEFSDFSILNHLEQTRLSQEIVQELQTKTKNVYRKLINESRIIGPE